MLRIDLMQSILRSGGLGGEFWVFLFGVVCSINECCRFDREFYFPLPSLSARRRILEINTVGWKGWTGDEGVEHIQKLAEVTKGYGGADLRVRAQLFVCLRNGNQRMFF